MSIAHRFGRAAAFRVRPAIERERIELVAISVAVILFLINLWGQRDFIHDDAFISLRYVRNFLELGDLSWNPGDRVEGYTNFLHILATSGVVSLGVDPVAALRVVNAVSVAGLFAAFWAGTRIVAPEAPAIRAMALLILGSTSALALWVMGGLEAVTVAAFDLAALALLLPAFVNGRTRPGQEPGRETGRETGRAALAGLLFALAYLTRPDAVVILAAAIGGYFLFADIPLRRRLLHCAILGAIPALAIALHLLWRFDYYGELLPNTYYAKLGVDLATRFAAIDLFFLRSVRNVPLIYLALGIGGWLLVRGRASRATLFLGGATGAHVLYVFWSGGDHMPGSRVLIPVLAPALLLLATGLQDLDARLRRWGAILAGLAAVASFVLSPARPMDTAAFIGKAVGLHIAEAWPADSTVALHTAGSTPYFADRMTFIDMLGLNDKTIARREDVPLREARLQRLPGHSKGDGAYVLSREPDYVIIGPADGTTLAKPWFLSDVELAESPEFRRCYAHRQVPLTYPPELAARGDPRYKTNTFDYYQRVCD